MRTQQARQHTRASFGYVEENPIVVVIDISACVGLLCVWVGVVEKGEEGEQEQEDRGFETV
eukprot:1327521-Amorphochlora_amoeboformis.AAC.1